MQRVGARRDGTREVSHDDAADPGRRDRHDIKNAAGRESRVYEEEDALLTDTVELVERHLACRA
jgi:hypothetical protein